MPTPRIEAGYVVNWVLFYAAVGTIAKYRLELKLYLGTDYNLILEINAS